MKTSSTSERYRHGRGDGARYGKRKRRLVNNRRPTAQARLEGGTLAIMRRGQRTRGDSGGRQTLAREDRGSGGNALCNDPSIGCIIARYCGTELPSGARRRVPRGCAARQLVHVLPLTLDNHGGLVGCSASAGGGERKNSSGYCGAIIKPRRARDNDAHLQRRDGAIALVVTARRAASSWRERRRGVPRCCGPSRASCCARKLRS